MPPTSGSEELSIRSSSSIYRLAKQGSHPSLARNVPRPDHHATDPFDHLGGTFTTRFLFEEFLRDVEFGAGVLFVAGNRLREAVGEVGPALSNMAGNRDGIDDVSVFKRVQQRTGAAQGVVDLLRRAGFVVMQGQEVAHRAPEFQRPLRKLILESRRI